MITEQSTSIHRASQRATGLHSGSNGREGVEGPEAATVVAEARIIERIMTGVVRNSLLLFIGFLRTLLCYRWYPRRSFPDKWMI
jgi:hypothetical protein